MGVMVVWVLLHKCGTIFRGSSPYCTTTSAVCTPRSSTQFYAGG
jgi:hypothetical protein